MKKYISINNTETYHLTLLHTHNKDKKKTGLSTNRSNMKNYKLQ